MDWSDVAVESSEYHAIACAQLRRGGGFWDDLVEVDETDRVLECEDVSVAPPQTSEGFCRAVLAAHRTELAAWGGG